MTVFVPHAYLQNIVSVITRTNVTFTTEGTDSDRVFVENRQVVTVAAVNVPHPVEVGWNPPREYRNEARAKKGLTEKTNTRTATIRVEKRQESEVHAKDIIMLPCFISCCERGKGSERVRQRDKW